MNIYAGLTFSSSGLSDFNFRLEYTALEKSDQPHRHVTGWKCATGPTNHTPLRSRDCSCAWFSYLKSDMISDYLKLPGVYSVIGLTFSEAIIYYVYIMMFCVACDESGRTAPGKLRREMNHSLPHYICRQSNEGQEEYNQQKLAPA